MDAYKELDDTGRRLVNKLISGLHEQKLDQQTRLTINRTINRTRRDPNDTGKKYTNGYLVFYKERFVDLKNQGPTSHRNCKAGGFGMEGTQRRGEVGLHETGSRREMIKCFRSR